MCATCCMPIKRRQHEFVFEFELKLKTKWKLKFVQRVDCLTLSRKFNWVVAAAARLSLSSRFFNLPHSKLAGWRSSAEAKLQQVQAVKAAVNSINRAIWRKQAAYKQQKLFRISAGKCKGRTGTGAARAASGAASGAGASNWFSAGLQFGCRRTGNYSESVLKCKRMCLARSRVCVCAACMYTLCVCCMCVCVPCILCMSAGNGDMTCNMTTEIAATAGYPPLLQLQRTTTTRCQIQDTSTLSSAWASAPAGFSFLSVL